MEGRLLLYRVLALHVQFPGHLVAVVGEEIVVEGLLVAGYRTADTRSMGGEDGADLGQFIVDVEGTKTAHPLIGMIDDSALRIEIEDLRFVETLYHQTGSIREHRGLVVVAIGMERIHLVFLPQPGVDVVFLLEEGLEVHQDGNGLARNGPAPYPHVQSLFTGRPLPLGKQRFLFTEIEALALFPKIRTDEDNLILKGLLQCLCTS